MSHLEFDTKLVNIHSSLKPAAYNLTRDITEAEDLIQETMVKAISNREKFREGTNLNAWMYTIMRNTFITKYNRTVRRKTFIDTTENLHYINSTNYSIENTGESSINMDQILKAVESISIDLRTPFMMHYNGWKYYEIAEELNIPMGTVKNRIHVARKELQKKLWRHNPKNN